MNMHNQEFKPSLFHPYYLIRTRLYEKISQYAGVLNGRMLDFGCGSKPYKPLLNVEEYVGVDIENEGHSHENEEIDVYYDGKTIPFEDNYFDSALTSEVFEHVFELPAMLKEINRVLKPGAKILITCPFVWKEHEVPNDFARYTEFAMRDMLTKAGFEVVSFDKSGNFIEVISQLRVLYFFDTIYPKVARIPVFSWLFRLLFMFIPNISALMAGSILPRNKTLYFNNIIVASKVHEKKD